MTTAVKPIVYFLLILCLLSSCTYNPLRQNRLTGSPIGVAAGAGIGAGTMALLGGSREFIWLGGIGGAAIGYYVTTLRYQAGDIISYGGEAYEIGDYLYIDILTDFLFESNTTRIVPGGRIFLENTATLLGRYKYHHIIIQGNTSGFDREKREIPLSRARAKVVRDYLIEQGFYTARMATEAEAEVIRVQGLGFKKPIAHTYTNDSIRRNSHIYIIAYPTDRQLHTEKYRSVFQNIGAMDDSQYKARPSCSYKGEC